MEKLARLSKKHSDAEVETAMTLVATLSGQYRKAAAMLGQRGIEVDESTLRRWCKVKHADLYQQIREREAPKLRKQIAHDSRDLIVEFSDMEREVAGKLRSRLDELEVRDLAPTMRNIGVNKGIAADTALKMEASEQPTVPALEEASEIIVKWKRKGIVESTATEEPIKQVPANVQSDSP